jgi:hypothetical protein
MTTDKNSRSTPPPPERKPGGLKPAPLAESMKATFSVAEKKPIVPNIVIQGVEGWGKTTLAAYAPTPLILQCGGENGYQTLVNAGAAPEVLTYQVKSWRNSKGDGLINLLEQIAAPDFPHAIQTLVTDSLAGAAELCRQYVCDTFFESDWGHGTQTGYAAFSKGDNSVAPAEWKIFDALLGKINRKGIIVIQIAHTAVEKFENPMGETEHRYTSSIVPKFWELTKRNADVVLFGKFAPTRDKTGDEKLNAVVKRVIFCEHRDAFHAKNRFSMLPSFDMPDEPKEMWNTLWAEIHRNVIR